MPIVIADHAFNKDGSFRYVENVDLGFRGDTLVVNAAISPRMRVERRKYRLRFLNASNARSYTLRLGSGHPMTQIAGDGGLLERPVRRRSIPIHPAERIDLVIDFRDYRPGTELVLQNTDGSGGTVAIMRFDVVRGGGEDARARARSRSAAEAGHEPHLGSRARHRGVGDQRQVVRPGPDRRRAEARHVRALDLRQPLRPRAPDAPARLPVPGAVALEWARASGRPARVEGHGGAETVTVQAWFAPYGGRVRVPLPRARARDKAMMLQMEVQS